MQNAKAKRWQNTYEEYIMQEVVWICTFCSIASINRQRGGLSRWNCSYVSWWYCMHGSWRQGQVFKICNFITQKHAIYLWLKINMEADLAYPDINVNVSSKIDITFHWFQKPTDNGIILNICSYAQVQHLKNEIQGTVHRVFNATSNCSAFGQPLEKNKTWWTKSQYPKEWSSKIMNQRLEKMRSGSKDQSKTTP